VILGTSDHQSNKLMVANNWQTMTSYWCSIVTLGLGVTIVEL